MRFSIQCLHAQPLRAFQSAAPLLLILLVLVLCQGACDALVNETSAYAAGSAGSGPTPTPATTTNTLSNDAQKPFSDYPSLDSNGTVSKLAPPPSFLSAPYYNSVRMLARFLGYETNPQRPSKTPQEWKEAAAYADPNELKRSVGSNNTSSPSPSSSVFATLATPISRALKVFAGAMDDSASSSMTNVDGMPYSIDGSQGGGTPSAPEPQKLGMCVAVGSLQGINLVLFPEKYEFPYEDYSSVGEYFCSSEAPAQFQCRCSAATRCTKLLDPWGRNIGECTCCQAWVFVLLAIFVLLIIIIALLLVYGKICSNKWWFDGYPLPIRHIIPPRGSSMIAPANAPIPRGIFRGFPSSEFTNDVPSEQVQASAVPDPTRNSANARLQVSQPPPASSTVSLQSEGSSGEQRQLLADFDSEIRSGPQQEQQEQQQRVKSTPIDRRQVRPSSQGDERTTLSSQQPNAANRRAHDEPPPSVSSARRKANLSSGHHAQSREEEAEMEELSPAPAEQRANAPNRSQSSGGQKLPPLVPTTSITSPVVAPPRRGRGGGAGPAAPNPFSPRSSNPGTEGSENEEHHPGNPGESSTARLSGTSGSNEGKLDPSTPK